MSYFVTPEEFLLMVERAYPKLMKGITTTGLPNSEIAKIADKVKFSMPPDGSLAGPFLVALWEHIGQMDKQGVLRKKRKVKEKLDHYTEGGSW